ncbi:SPOR domain-containing protein [Sphingosinicellaceae bacterium]|nr:SPOR domain-containing protein [Sphingosinicellaceae bacterium]
MLSLITLAVGAAAVGQPATVQSGVERWRAGDYPAAVAAWLPFAAQGDADACFNMGQAYKLGRGVAKDPAVARDYYRRAALKGHLPAQANLGIALFQAGDKLEAVKWLKQAADRGEARAQYVLGIAAYNGDGTPKNLGLAYGYLLRAQASGLAQATTALGSIEPVLTPDARSAGTAMAASLAAGTGVPSALAAASIQRTGPAGIQRPGSLATNATGAIGTAAGNVVASVRSAFGFAPPPPVVTKPVTQTADASLSSRTFQARPPAAVVPNPARSTTVRPPADITTAYPVTHPAPKLQSDASAAVPGPKPFLPGTTPPAPKPIDNATAVPDPRPVAPATATARGSLGPPNPGDAATTTATSAPTATVPAATPLPKPVLADARPAKADVVDLKPATVALADLKPVPAKPAGWRVQLGAFSSQKLADAAWASVKSANSGAIGKAKPIFDSAGPVVKFQLGPFASRDAARDTCAKLAFAGKACFVTQG